MKLFGLFCSISFFVAEIKTIWERTGPENSKLVKPLCLKYRIGCGSNSNIL